ncbi:MAG: hypothetical protein KAJ01_07015 [Candidatus Hydrogenedentes bacterium]|nr:hypothetical protein [Candidatus Hydrogenedentota bacterium]
MMKRILVLSAPWVERFLGLLFIVSAALKAMDITAFAVQVSYYGVVRGPALVRLAAVFTVWLETALGVALVTGWRLRGWTLRVVFGLLLGFTGLILYAWAFKGLEECGCFGKYLQMSPGVSVLKNLVMMGLVAAAWFGYRKSEPSPVTEKVSIYKHYAGPVAAALCVGVVLGAFAYGQRNYGGAGGIGQPYDKDRPFAQFRFEADGELWDLGDGEYFVALLSDSCDHCAETMQELNELPSFLPDIPPIIGLFLGEEEILEQLREQVDPEFPTFLIEPLTFFDLLGDARAPPRFVYVRDGKGVHHWDEELPEDIELLKAFSDSSESPSTPH